jgi:hypothetical protein
MWRRWLGVKRYLGVTVVEVIVVMGIMLLLMAILLPAACKLYHAVEGLKGGK